MSALSALGAGQEHTVDITPMPTVDDAHRYRWECSCGAAGAAPGWVDDAPEFHLQPGDTITYRHTTRGA